MTKYFFSFFLLFSIFIKVQCQINTCELDGTTENNCFSVIETAVPLLRANVDGRSAGMGNSGIAHSSKNNTVFFNSAKMIFDENDGGLSLNYVPWLRQLGVTDIYLSSITGFYKLNEYQAVGGSLRYFSYGEIQFTDFTGTIPLRDNPKEIFIDVTYANKISDYISIGGNLKYIHSDLTKGQQLTNGEITKIGRAFAIDLSAFYTLPLATGNLSAGLSISNIGNKISYIQSNSERDYLPSNLGIGIAYKLNLDDESKISIAYDANKLLVPTPKADGSHIEKSAIAGMFSSFGDTSFNEELHEINHSIGLEFFINDYLFFDNGFGLVRTGFFAEHKTKGNRKYFTLGVGYQIKPFEIAISRLFTRKHHPLSRTHRISLLYHL